MPASQGSTRDQGWALFDHIVAEAASSEHSNPWSTIGGRLHYEPDFTTLTRLLGVPLLLDASSQSGVPALALDVWTAYELRRAGFEPDAVWPRASVPRILPASISRLLDGLPASERKTLLDRVESGKTLGGAVGSSARILGKNYVKQVDVVLSAWDTGPEIMISTKRMDSSFGKNAANRVEESYGDAKNLRSRHPQAALGFVYGLRSTVLTQEPDKAEWLIDLLAKLGREDDAYDAVGLLVLDYDDEPPPGDDEDTNPLVDAGLELSAHDEENPDQVDRTALVTVVKNLPLVRLRHDVVPESLQPGTFIAKMINRVLDNCPINFHAEARSRRTNPRSPVERNNDLFGTEKH